MLDIYESTFHSLPERGVSIFIFIFSFFFHSNNCVMIIAGVVFIKTTITLKILCGTSNGHKKKDISAFTHHFVPNMYDFLLLLFFFFFFMHITNVFGLQCILQDVNNTGPEALPVSVF